MLNAVAEAIYEYLDTISGLPPIAYPNVAFDPEGESYLRLNILPTETFPVGLSQLNRAGGIVQLDACVKDDTGSLSALALADAVIDCFPRNFSLKTQGLSIEFTRLGWAAPLQFEPGWVFVPVSIPYLLIF